ncbi:MAG: hypothetical protein KIT16_10825 [Rhodospirillaceae bacterium]|nr:hypothetical protein [Rhodospirillaceae bacterium]
MLRAIATAGLIAGLALPAPTLPAWAEKPATPPGIATCTEPRPQMCTQDYKPVCATKADGTRRTYSNGCMACADKSVVSHVPGPCP